MRCCNLEALLNYVQDPTCVGERLLLIELRVLYESDTHLGHVTECGLKSVLYIYIY